MGSINSVQIEVPAKVNVYLEITGKRPDGYHLLNTLMQKIDLYDSLDVRLISKPHIELACSDDAVPADESNLVWKAASLFVGSLEETEQRQNGVAMHLEKNIPVAAGLGGGSSDAAAALKALNVLYSYPFKQEQLSAMGLQLGADVPFFLEKHSTCWAEGVGEILRPATTISGITFVIVNTGVHVSTKWVYENFALTKQANTCNLESSRGKWIHLWEKYAARQQFPGDQMVNDLEAVTVARYPAIDLLKGELIQNGASAAMMSGSGPTVFGVFTQQEKAEECCEILRNRYSFVRTANPLDC